MDYGWVACGLAPVAGAGTMALCLAVLADGALQAKALVERNRRRGWDWSRREAEPLPGEPFLDCPQFLRRAPSPKRFIAMRKAPEARDRPVMAARE